MLDSILESIRVLALPTKTDFRAIKLREVALWEGPCGWAEFSPFLEYGPKECVPWLASAIECATVVAPAAIRSAIYVNATLPAVNGREKISEVLSWFPGCSVVKIKVGGDFAEDLARISLVRELIPDSRIRLDVNGRWSVGQATTFLRDIYQQIGPIEYVEQPCATIEELGLLKENLVVPTLIAGDEVIRKAADPLGVDLRGAVDIVMLKVAPLGGISRALQVAEHHGLPVVVSSAMESAVGISYGLKLAASLPVLSYACGLGTGGLLGVDVAALPIVDGKIEVATVRPSEAALAKYAASHERVDWWKERIRQSWLAGTKEWVEREGWSW
jgi:O-succinylbenzoate synthase